MNSLRNYSKILKQVLRPDILLSKKFNFVVTLLAMCLLFSACGRSSERKQAQELREETAAILEAQSEIVTDTINGVTHNFVRNANIKCKVKDVLSSTKDIEDLVSKNGGYISHSDLTSTIIYNNTVQIKKDSLMELSHYNTSNMITMRVPNRMLDTVIRKIADMAIFIDYRKLNSDDVKLKLAATKLTEARLLQFDDKVEKKTTAKKASGEQIVCAESSILDKQALADEARIASYALAEQVNYSTVQLEIYQDQKISTQILAKPANPEPYEAPFTTKIGSSFINGFELLKNGILFLINSWGLILILTGIFLLIRKLVRDGKDSGVALK